MAKLKQKPCATETNILGPQLTDQILSQFASEQDCIDKILNGTVTELPWQIDSRGEQFLAMPLCAGHIYSQPEVKGPQPTPIMVIGKLPRPSDVYDDENNSLPITQCFHTNSHAGEFFLDSASSFGVDPTAWYVTYLFKTLHPEDINRGSRLRAPWLKESMPILQYEITQVAPSYILLFGAEAVKALFGNKAKITTLTGTVLDYEYVDYEGKARVAKCVACTSPHAVVRSSDNEEMMKYKAAFQLFVNVLKDDIQEETYEHLVIRTLTDWKKFLAILEEEVQNNLVAIDAEWNGQHPQNSDAWIRTIQFSWKPNTAAAIIIRDEDGKCQFSDDELATIKSDFFNKIWTQYIIAGHFLDADTEMLVGEGFVPQLWDLPHIPTTADEYKTCTKNGQACLFDTAMAAHAYNETANHSLTGQYMMLCPTVPRYDAVMDEWKKDYCKKNKLKEKELAGFGACPDDTIIYYGCYDADVTRRIAVWYINHLDRDEYGLDCWPAFTNSMQQWPAFLEMNCTGLDVDRGRINDLMDCYDTKAEKLMTKIRRDTAWKGLNLNSAYQLRELLFGEKYNFAKQAGCLRPDKAITLALEPLYATDGTPWEKAVKENGDLAVPACNARTLSMLAARYKASFEKTGDVKDQFRSDILTNIRSVKLLRKALSYVLKDSITDDDGVETEQGLSAFICDDGKLRTHLYCTLDSGRAASARPAMQNISKKREADYKVIVGDEYIAPLRSILVAPEGHMLIAADFLGAELHALAVLSGDEVMLDHVARNQLDEDDPNFYDIHSSVAVTAFKLNCEPTKKGLEKLGKGYIRVVAKSIIFGMAYGRGAAAISEAVKEEGVFVTVDEVKAVMDAIKKTYRKAMAFLNEAAEAVYEPGYIVGVANRFRRKPKHTYLPNDKLAELQRIFKNFPEQNYVAEAMRNALYNLYSWRFNHNDVYNICLQVHDEVLLSAPYEHVINIVDKVIPYCMVDNNTFYPITLAGDKIMDRGPYKMGVDITVSHKYGMKEKEWRDLCLKHQQQKQ